MLHSREVVSLHFGQAGIQMGHAAWETLIAEHGVDCHGMRQGNTNNPDMNNMSDENSLRTLFHHSPTDQYVPRCVMIDTEPTVVDEVRTGFYRQLFHPDMLISGSEDASNNYARGFYTLGKQLLPIVVEKTRFVVETCDNFKGFLTFSGSGGGTGSGFYSLVCERLSLEFCSKACLGTLVLPGVTLNDAIVEPYNSVFRINHSSTNGDLNLLVDNESLYRICTQKCGIPRPSYANINRLLAPVISSVTASLRFTAPTSGDLTEIITNLVPYPRINFPTVSYAPFVAPAQLEHESLESESLTRDIFSEDHSLLGLDLRQHRIMSSLLAFRGRHNRTAFIEALNKMKRDKQYQWVEWCPTGFKVTENYLPALHSYSGQPLRSVMMLCNHSGVGSTLAGVYNKFGRLFEKRCFLHWFVGEGMEESEFTDAYYDMMLLKRDYEEICRPTDETEDEEDLLIKSPQGTQTTLGMDDVEEDEEDEDVRVTSTSFDALTELKPTKKISSEGGSVKVEEEPLPKNVDFMSPQDSITYTEKIDKRQLNIALEEAMKLSRYGRVPSDEFATMDNFKKASIADSEDVGRFPKSQDSQQWKPSKRYNKDEEEAFRTGENAEEYQSDIEEGTEDEEEIENEERSQSKFKHSESDGLAEILPKRNTEDSIVREKQISEYQLSDRTKEILMKNVTTLSPEMRQRLLGFS